MRTKFTTTRRTRGLLGLTMSVAVAASLAIGAPAAGAAEPCLNTLDLSPAAQTRDLGQPASITGTAACGTDPVVGVPLTFTVASGPNAGKTFTTNTDSNGKAVFTYTSTLVGTDTVNAKYGSTPSFHPATVTWTKPKPALRYTGYAYNAAAKANALGVLPITLAPVNPIGPVDTTATTDQSNKIINVGGPILNAAVLEAGVKTGSGSSTAFAKTASATVFPLLALTPLISNVDVLAESSATCSAKTGKTTIASLKIGGTVIVGPGGSLANDLFVPAPNTTINVINGLNLVKIVLNEQIVTADKITVNAIHVTVNALVAKADVIVSHAESDIHNCA